MASLVTEAVAEYKIKEIKEQWRIYTEMLMIKYPSDNWDFTCRYHKNIDKLIKAL